MRTTRKVRPDCIPFILSPPYVVTHIDLGYTTYTIVRTCLPVNPWQMTRVFLSTQTLAVDDMDRRPTAAVRVADRTANLEIIILTSLTTVLVCFNVSMSLVGYDEETMVKVGKATDERRWRNESFPMSSGSRRRKREASSLPSTASL